MWTLLIGVSDVLKYSNSPDVSQARDFSPVHPRFLYKTNIKVLPNFHTPIIGGNDNPEVLSTCLQVSRQWRWYPQAFSPR